MASAAYNPTVFEAPSMDAAMSIILTPDGEQSTAERWRKETPYLVKLSAKPLDLTPDSVVLDYGCGIGRMSRALIQKYGCRVIGADISANMRALAVGYVDSPRFAAIHPEMLPALGQIFDAAFSIWAIQHCHRPADDVLLIRDGLKPGACVFIVNAKKRFVPASSGQTFQWVDDGVDVLKLLDAAFKRAELGDLDGRVVSKTTADHAYWWAGQHDPTR